MELSPGQIPHVRSHQPSQPREASPILTSFNKCLKLIDQLSSPQDTYDLAWTGSRISFDAHASKLRAWGNDTGATSWSLDHTLRKASLLQQQVLLLLNGLQYDLQTALQIGQQHLRPLNSDVTPAPIHDADVLEASSSAALAEGNGLDMPGGALQIVDENITETLLCLSALVPALQDPTPQDTYLEDNLTTEELKDIDLAMFMFPKASSNLIRRLGHANWKRRQFQRGLAERRAQQQTLAVKQIRNELLAATSPKVTEQELVSGTQAGPASESERNDVGFDSDAALKGQNRKEHIRSQGNLATVAQENSAAIPESDSRERLKIAIAPTSHESRSIESELENVTNLTKEIKSKRRNAETGEASLGIKIHRAVMAHPKNSISRHGTIFSGDSSITGILSDPETVFSKSLQLERHSANSTTASEGRARVRHLEVPEPPVDTLSGEVFVCPYCLQGILAGDDIVSAKDWEDHVFVDLEPYMCTFDNCIRADKTFGLRDEWFRHELDSHRILNVWFCQSCILEFGDSQGLKDHLKEIHGSTMASDQLSMVVSMCERKSQAPILNQSCALCRFVCSDAETLKDHLAVHFEQLSLTSINMDGEDDPILSQLDGGSPESELKKERLETFLHELRENAFAKKHEGGDDGKDVSSDSVSGLLGDSSDDDSSEHANKGAEHSQLADPSRRISTKLQVEAYSLKVERYLDQQSKIFYKGPESDLASLQSYDIKSESLYEPMGQMETIRSIRTMPPPRNQAFVGRQSDLDKLYEDLSKPGRICVLSGTGGIGKSATAIEYTYKFEQDYAYIFWVQAETPVSCGDSYGQIATHLGLTGDEVIRDQERLIVLSREFLERTGKRWLLVFDNVDDMLALQQFLPSNLLDTRGSILITTRNSSGFGPLAQMSSRVELGVLDLDDCRRLLLTSTGENPKDMRTHPEYKLAGDIATYSGRLPLALSHIAGYIQQSGCSLEDFVELWQERLRHTTLHPPTKDGVSLNPTEKTLEIVWNIGLREVTIDARELLNILAFLDSDTIQKDLLVGEHHEPSLEFLHSSEKFRYKRMTSELARRRLINIKAEDGQDTLSIHRALQLKILKDLDKDPQNREKVFRQAFMLVRKKFPTPSPIQVPEPHKWPVYIKYVPHILSLRKVFVESVVRIAPTAEFARLLSDGGMSLWERARTNESLELLRSAESILDQISSHEDMLRANIHVIIGILIEGQGFTHVPESLDRFQKALKARLEYQKTTPPEKYTKNEEILLYNAHCDYAVALLQYNNYKEAEPIFDSCLAKYREWGTEDEIPYEYSKYHHNKALCSMYQREFDKAIKLAERSVHNIITATGQSPSTNAWNFTLACILLQSGDARRALLLHREVLEARIQQHGTSNYLTSQSYYAVGALYAMTGDLPAAEIYMRKALGSEHLRRETHPEVAVARVQFHLSQILRQQDKSPEEARDLETRARVVLNRLLPLNPLEGVPKRHELALFDHLQPLLGGARFTGRMLLHYIC